MAGVLRSVHTVEGEASSHHEAISPPLTQQAPPTPPTPTVQLAPPVSSVSWSSLHRGTASSWCRLPALAYCNSYSASSPITHSEGSNTGSVPISNTTSCWGCPWRIGQRLLQKPTTYHLYSVLSVWPSFYILYSKMSSMVAPYMRQQSNCIACPLHDHLYLGLWSCLSYQPTFTRSHMVIAAIVCYTKWVEVVALKRSTML